MLRITIPAQEWYDERTSEFIETKEQTLLLEHSLLSLSKWESKWKKPFLDPKTKKTQEESIDYLRCMTVTQNVDPLIYYGVTKEIMDQVNAYIDDSMTATWFSSTERRKGKVNREIITSELIYYWMITFQIPFECQKWHLNRLLTLIQVCNIKNSPARKMSKREILERNRELNAARRKQTGSSG